MQQISKINNFSEGRLKVIHATENPELYIMEYKKDAPLANGEAINWSAEKASIACEVSCILFERLQKMGVANHFVKKISEYELVVSKLHMAPLEVVARNVIGGGLARRLGLEEGIPIFEPIFEYYYKNLELGNPFVNSDHIRILDIMSQMHTAELKEIAFSVNACLTKIFKEVGITLVAVKCEYGLDSNGNVVLADEISPDSCRLWDGEKRVNLGNSLEGFRLVLKRLSGK